MFISFVFISIFNIIPGHFILMSGDNFGSFENPIQTTLQVFHNFVLFLSISISILIIGHFNYYGTSLTKYSSSMHRCLVDASRMCIVWVRSIICKWGAI